MTDYEKQLTEALEAADEGISQRERYCIDLENDLEDMKWSKERLEDELWETQAELREARETLRRIQSEFDSGRPDLGKLKQISEENRG